MDNKIRIYELAKELNTNSKTLIDKLKAININVKNHMSILEEHELKSIYEYFGVNIKSVKPEESSAAAVQTADKSQEEPVKDTKTAAANAGKPENKKSNKSAPRIIRTHVTEIRTDTITGVTTEIHTEIKGDSKREVRTNVIKEPPKVEKPEFYDFRKQTKPDITKNQQEVKINSEMNNDRISAKNENEAIVNNEIVKEDKSMETKIESKIESKTENMPEQKIEEKVQTETKVEKFEAKPAATEKANNILNDKQPAKSFENRSDKIPAYNDRQEKPYSNNRPSYDRGQNPAGNNYNNNNQQRRDNNTNNSSYNQQKRDFNRNQPNNNSQQPNQDRFNRNNQGNNFSKDRQQGPGRTGDRPQYNNNNNYNSPYKKRDDFKPGQSQYGGQRFDAEKRLNNQIEKAFSENDEFKQEPVRPLRRESVLKDRPKDTKKDGVKPQKAPIKNNDRGFDRNTIKSLNIGKKVNDILNDDNLILDLYDEKGHKKLKKAGGVKGKRQDEMQVIQEPVKVSLKVVLPESITVKDFAEKLKKQSGEIIKKLFTYGVMATLNQEIDYDTAATIAEEYGYSVEKEVVVSEEDLLFDETQDNPQDLEPRAPIVVVMGHVDHGKTSLLDAIRETNVIEKEAGGITQHIGAYSVKINERKITFLDTPGHEAFTAMRARGAQITDIAILVVAADDGVMPQTIEAINHAKAANVSIIVAVNKIDKPGANPDRVKQELMEYGLVAEEWGGDTIFADVSAKKRIGIDRLLEMVLLVADMQELKANPNKQAKGTVIEAKLDKGRGPVATVLVQRGTLKLGDAIITGTTVGRIRAMIDDKGQKVKKAKPSTPVEIVGLSEVPEAGDIFYVIEDEKMARQLAEKRKFKQREQTIKSSSKITLDDLYTQIQQGKMKDLNIIVKADVQGSVEAIKQSLEKITNEEVRVKIIHGGVGAITESDVMLANVSNAIIIGFNVRPEASARDMAEREKVDIKLYRVIYEAIDDITAAMKGMLEPKFKEVILGHAEVRQIFKASGIGTIAGCYVTDGKITRNSDVRIIRNGIVAFEGKIASLKRFKDDAKEVSTGFECGISLEKFNDIKEQDVIEAFTEEKVVD